MESASDTFDPAAYRRELEESAARRKLFLQKLMAGPDLYSWIVPDGNGDADATLNEHLVQLRNAVRFALQYALSDAHDVQVKLSAAATVTRMIQTNVALTKALKASANSKTVRGVRKREDPQD